MTENVNMTCTRQLTTITCYSTLMMKRLGAVIVTHVGVVAELSSHLIRKGVTHVVVVIPWLP